MKSIYIIIILFITKVAVFAQPHINITFENRSLSGNTWTFDLVAQVLPTYVGGESNWSAANVRTNIEVPGGVSITSMTGTPVNSTVQAATGQNNFGGGSVAGTVKYGIFLERNALVPDLVPNTTVTLASMSVTFSSVVPSMNLVTPRPFGGSAQSFWNTIIDPTARPFGLPAAFPLPIKIKTFDVVKDGDRSSKLNWVSSSEINSDYFGVERSKDGSTWETIGKVNAAGNSNTDIAYEYFDRNLPMTRNSDNIFYYRLKLTDQDGYFKYSDIRGVNFGKVSGDVISIYPNPTYEVINVDLSGMDMLEGDIHLSVFDNAGRSMIQKNITGNGIELIEVNQYPAGTYNVMVKQGDTVHQKKIIKIN